MAKHKVKRYDDGGDIDINAEMGDKYSSQAKDIATTKDAAPTEDESDRGVTQTAKPKVVTKEQMEAAGYTNLRDYLNATNPGGPLKRRDGSAAEKPSISKPTTPASAKTSAPTNAPASAKTSAPTNAPKKYEYESPADRLGRENREKGIDFDSVMKRVGSKIKDAVSSNSRVKPSESGRIDTANLNRKTLLPSKMAKGGMTASSRGDGIAKRGHTRGKLC